MTLGSFRYW